MCWPTCICRHTYTHTHADADADAQIEACLLLLMLATAGCGAPLNTQFLQTNIDCYPEVGSVSVQKEVCIQETKTTPLDPGWKGFCAVWATSQ